MPRNTRLFASFPNASWSTPLAQWLIHISRVHLLSGGSVFIVSVLSPVFSDLVANGRENNAGARTLLKPSKINIQNERASMHRPMEVRRCRGGRFLGGFPPRRNVRPWRSMAGQTAVGHEIVMVIIFELRS